MSKWIGIDPSATATGLAYACPTGWDYSEVPITRECQIIKYNLALWRISGARHMLIEAQFVGPNPQRALDLAAIKGRIVQMAIDAGYERIEQIESKKWQKEILGVPGNAKTAERKAASIAHVRAMGIDTDSDNIADAICIAQYAETILDRDQVSGQE